MRQCESLINASALRVTPSLRWNCYVTVTFVTYIGCFDLNMSLLHLEFMSGTLYRFTAKHKDQTLNSYNMYTTRRLLSQKRPKSMSHSFPTKKQEERWNITLDMHMVFHWSLYARKKKCGHQGRYGTIFFRTIRKIVYDQRLQNPPKKLVFALKHKNHKVYEYQFCGCLQTGHIFAPIQNWAIA